MKFKLDKKQKKSYKKWIKIQMKKNSFLPTAGERFSFIFTPCAFGVIVNVNDDYLNESIDLTNWEI
jgi:hypothetical protein